MTNPDSAPPVVGTGQDGPATLLLAGELDDAHEVRTAIRAASDGYARALQVDLSQVTYLPSLVIGALFTSMKAAADAGTVVEVAIRSGSVVEQVLRITGMPHVVL